MKKVNFSDWQEMALKKDIERQRELNKGYLQELKAFLTDLNTLNRKNSHSDFIWKLR